MNAAARASVAVLVAATSALGAEKHVTTAAEICPGTANPCIVSETITVDGSGDLDFGLKNIRVTKPGRITAERADIRCGSFFVEGPEPRIGIAIPDSDEPASFKVTARRGCSLSPSTPCLDDQACASQGFGTCSVGTGSITLEGKLDGKRRYGPDVELRAAGDVVIGNSVNVNGAGPFGAAGELSFVSFLGDVRIAADVRLRAGPPPEPDEYGYTPGPGYGGRLECDAGRDLRVSGPVDAAGGGEFDLRAARDVWISDDMSRDAYQGFGYFEGGPGAVRAGRNITFSPKGPNERETFFSSNGGNYRFLYRDDYGLRDYWKAGPGGYTWMRAGGSVVVERLAHVQSDSPLDECYEGNPYGGSTYVYADEGVRVDGWISSHANGRCSSGGEIQVFSYGDASIGSSGVVDASAGNAGRIAIDADGNLAVAGRIDVHGEQFSFRDYSGSWYFFGRGGTTSLRGDDLTVDGTLDLRGVERGAYSYLHGCRIRLGSTALIDGRCTPNLECDDSDHWIDAYEIFVSDAGSRVLAEQNSPTEIFYATEGGPATILGTFDPPPVLKPCSGCSVPSASCPLCGNGRTEEGETCDDWNVTDGDGCTSECVSEACIAETPGYPGVPLCDDASSCTDDRCDPLAKACVHEPACRDDLACTLEGCVDDVCVAIADDAHCDDVDPCTSDLCNQATGCVHGRLVDVACDDSDICTPASACDAVAGCVGDPPRPALQGRLRVGAKADGRMETLVADVDVPVDEVFSPVDETGVQVHLYDTALGTLFDGFVAGEHFAADGNRAFDYLFEDRRRTIAETGGITMLHVEKVGSRKARVRLRLKRSDLEFAAGAEHLGISVVFGEDPADDGCATLRFDSCRKGRKTLCRG